MIAALDEGADDYVTKPYSMPQLLARLGVALRHHDLLAKLVEDESLSLGDVRLDLASHVVVIDGAPIDVTRREFLLLSGLMRNAGKVLTYRSVSLLVWGPDHELKLTNVRNLVKLLRDRLGTSPRRPLIETEPGVGYRLVLPTASSVTDG
jgi:two-component system, OmpR family, KDP operon response regulator KdpE